MTRIRLGLVQSRHPAEAPTAQPQPGPSVIHSASSSQIDQKVKAKGEALSERDEGSRWLGANKKGLLQDPTLSGVFGEREEQEKEGELQFFP